MYYKKSIGSDSTLEISFMDCIKSKDRIDFIAVVEDFCQSSSNTLIFNFGHTVYIDSAGLGFILIAKQITDDTEKELILKNPSANVKKLFELMNFNSIFNIEEH